MFILIQIQCSNGNSFFPDGAEGNEREGEPLVWGPMSPIQPHQVYSI